MAEETITSALASFIFGPLPTRTVFGPRSIRVLAQETERAGFTRVILLSTPRGAGLAGELAGSLPGMAAGVHDGATMHADGAAANTALQAIRDARADGCIAVGGGSAIGLAKAVALAGGPGFIAVPTTYAGSEMTPIWGLVGDGVKRTGRDPRVRPATAIYDPELTLTLPPATSAASGINALAHAVEALYAPDLSPLVSLMADAAIHALTHALPAIAADPGDRHARTAALYGSWLAGCCLGETTMSLHHKLCHTLGGTFGLPHAETHAVLLPYVLAHNAPGAPAALAALRRTLADDDPVTGLWTWTRSLPVPRSLRSLGMTQPDVSRAVELTLRDAYANPVRVTAGSVRDLLTAALDGERLPDTAIGSNPQARIAHA